MANNTILSTGTGGDVAQSFDNSGIKTQGLTLVSTTGTGLATTNGDLISVTSSPNLLSINYDYNSSNYDRMVCSGRAKTTGDTGTITATGVGIIQTNVGYKGVQTLIIVSSITGTSPSITFKMQGSVDNSNFYDIPAAITASLTSGSGSRGIQVHPNITVTAPVATTGTTSAAMETLPRFWRIAWTVAGTSPVISLTNIQYSYLTL